MWVGNYKIAHPPYLPTLGAAGSRGVRCARGYQQWKRPFEKMGYFMRMAAARAAIGWCCKDMRLSLNKQALIWSNPTHHRTDYFDAFDPWSDRGRGEKRLLF